MKEICAGLRRLNLFRLVAGFVIRHADTSWSVSAFKKGFHWPSLAPQNSIRFPDRNVSQKKKGPENLTL
jgi:hypothetical protein